MQWSRVDDGQYGNRGRIYIFRDISGQIETQQALTKSEEKYRALFDHMQEGVALHEIICNQDGQPIDYRFLDLNNAFEEMTGLRKADVVNKRVLEIFPDIELHWIETYGKVALEGSYIKFENYSTDVGKHFSITSFSPKKGQFAVICFDITERINLEKATIEERERLRTTLLSVGDGIIVTDKNVNVIMINEVAQKLTGFSETESLGRNFSDVYKIINEQTGEACRDPVQQVFQTGKINSLEEHEILVAKHGTYTKIADNAAPILDADGKIQGVVVVFRDITEETKRQQEITYLSYHDQLTGLYNRRYFEEQLPRLNITTNFPLSIIIIDVNGLKLINDAFGHVVGDQLIQKTAEVIKSACRADDIITRWGGDEFVVLLPKTNLEQTQAVVNRIKKQEKEACFEPAILSLAIGWSTKTAATEEIQDVFKKAEDYMYRHKLLISPKVKRTMVEAVNQQLHTVNIQEQDHAIRVSQLCETIAKKLRYSDHEIEELKTTALIHDIGKVAINPMILSKPGSLNADEWIEMKRHPEIGYRILSAVNEMANMADVVLTHHEHWDGSGYPKGLSGLEIPLNSRILLVAEAYDSMTNSTTYRDAMNKQAALNEIQAQAGKQFDPDIVSIFVDCMNELEHNSLTEETVNSND
ncbi:hypothetical protein BHU72_01050 [Desulfuribacillus stibiiarsenatis]|uniref:Diguanylate cyclase n=1 Tax=Desulfuribacillus stibiiarsenatis TaxID=1390249 RepID=A0A1E5LAA9_9FIRM|nr:hypothetical protein BHU72_01050 [Desulfuribacillus stibiiarsenatis]